MTDKDKDIAAGDKAPRPDVTQRKARRRWPHRVWHGCAWALSVLTLITVALAVVVLALRDQPLVAPRWLHDRLEARLDSSMPGLSVQFGEVSVILGDSWKPRLRLRDLQVQRVGSPARVSLSDIEGTIALEPLLQGKVQPHSIYLTGAQLRLRRNAEGGFDLALGDNGAARSEGAVRQTTSGADIAALADAVEQLLDLPDLAALDRIEANALTLFYEDARSGRAWTIDGGRVALERQGEELRLRGDFALLGGGDSVATLAVNYDSRIGNRAANLGLNFADMPAADIATQGAALAWLGVLDAPISGALRVSVDSEGQLGPLNATLQIGAGALRPTDDIRPIRFRSARSYFTYDPNTMALRFDELSVDSAYVTARAEGEVRLTGTRDGLPQEMVGQMRMTHMVANPGRIYPKPLEFEDVRADLRLQLAPFRLSLGQLRLAEAGGALLLSGEVNARPEGWDLTLDGAAEAMPSEALLALWPEDLGQKTRTWVSENVHRGELSNLQLGVRSLPGHKPDVYLGFEFREAEVTFIKDVPPLKDLAGHATLYQNRFAVLANAGHVDAPQGGRVSVAGTSFVVLATNEKPAPAQVSLQTDSTITAALALLNTPPFRFMEKAGQRVDMADGRASVTGTIDLKLMKDPPPETIQVAARATLRDLRSTVLVPGRTLAASEMTVTASNEHLLIEGPGRIGAVPFDGRFETGLGKAATGESRVTGWVELSERFMDEFRIGLPAGSVSGKGQAEVEIVLAKGKAPAFSMTSDLSGVGLRLTALDWSLPRAARGRISVSGAMASPPRIDRIEVDAPGLKASGAVELTAAGQLQRALFSRVQVGQWLDAPVELTGRGAGAAPAVAVTGGTVDLRRAKIDGGGSGSGGGPIRLALDRLQISDSLALTAFRGDFTTSGGMSGNFTGMLNGAAPVRGQMIGGGRASTIRLSSDNAGAVIAAGGLLKQGRGGKLDLVLVPTGAAGTYDGTLAVRGLWITDAPAMADLLSAISVVGLLEQMSGNGIQFSEVDARFRLTPTQVVLAESSAVGVSIGISMDGTYDLGASRLDMQGVISPIYLLNGIGSVLTRKGEGLIGFNFNLTGPSSAPQVSVNPLSIFTPGMFRELFRRPPPKLSQ